MWCKRRQSEGLAFAQFEVDHLGVQIDKPRPQPGDVVPWAEVEDGALYHRLGERCPFRMSDAWGLCTTQTTAPLIAHAEAPEQRLLVDTVGDVAWRVGEHGFWLRVAGRWAPMAERWSWDRNIITGGTTGGRWHAKG